jgi:hypothetical protein
VSLLLHGNQSGGQFIDSSLSPKTIIKTGSVAPGSPGGGTPAYPSNNSAFSNAILFNGSSDGLNVSGTHNALAMGTGDFTIEMYVYLNSLKIASFYDTLALNSSATNGIRIRTIVSGQVQIFRYADAVISSSVNLFATTWTHLALVKNQATLTLYISGVNRGSTADSAIYTCGSDRPAIGIDGYVFNTAYLDGYIDDLRITKGVARYTANFTPPAAPFPDI